MALNTFKNKKNKNARQFMKTENKNPYNNNNNNNIKCLIAMQYREQQSEYGKALALEMHNKQ